MTGLDESLLTESAWIRARRDTWPPGWRKKVGKRALIAVVALGANFFIREEGDRGGLVQSTLVGLGAFLFADVALYPMNALFAPKRQRDELRRWAVDELSKVSVKVSIRAATIRGRGDTSIIDVSNPGDVTVRDIVVELPESNCIQPIGWRSGGVVIKELRPGERGSVLFTVSRTIGRSTESVRAELRGRAGKGGAEKEVVTTVVIDPHRL